MSKVVEFPDKKGSRPREGAKTELLCRVPLATCIDTMRQLGAENEQIAKQALEARRAALDLEPRNDAS